MGAIEIKTDRSRGLEIRRSSENESEVNGEARVSRTVKSLLNCTGKISERLFIIYREDNNIFQSATHFTLSFLYVYIWVSLILY